MSTQPSKGRLDLDRLREWHRGGQAAARAAGPKTPVFTSRVKVKLLENQLKEGRLGKYTVLSDETVDRGGSDKGPPPLQYFLAGAAF